MTSRSVAFALLLALICVTEVHAASFSVTKTEDTNDGTCDSDCSLREAIQASTVLSGTEFDVITLPAGLYRLTIPRGVRSDNSPGNGSDGNLVVDTFLSIVGAGRDVTIIDARPSEFAPGVDRVLSLTLAGRLRLSGVTFAGGRTLGQGGGILSLRGQLELTDAAVVECNANTGGGGLAVSNGAMTTITRSLIADNTAGTMSGPSGSGGGIQNIQSTLTVIDSTISGNTALLSTGGGIMNIDQQNRPNPPAILNILGSTITGNLAGDPTRASIFEGVGGGVFNRSGRALIENSTITQNEAVPGCAPGFGCTPGSGRGGGVAHEMLRGDDANDGTTIVNSTIAYNTALTGMQVYAFIEFKKMILANTLVAGSPGATPDSNCASESNSDGIASFGGNLSSDASPCFFLAGADQPDTPPGLDAGLADNGGPTETIALLPGSAAIAGGSPISCPPTDQRGLTRNLVCDTGAVEFMPEPGASVAMAASLLSLAWLRQKRRVEVRSPAR